MDKEKEDKFIALCQECLDMVRPLLKGETVPMGVVPSETIYSNGDMVVPMADVQHIEKKTYSDGSPCGLWLITKHTRWDMGADIWSNPVYIPQKHADDFLKAWCYFRYEIDGIKGSMEARYGGEGYGEMPFARRYKEND